MEVAAPPETVPDRAQLAAALRDLENAKSRVERDARQVADDTRKDLVSQLLPVLDNLDRTIKAATEQGDAPAVIEGIGLVKSQLEGVLRSYGVERIDAAGQPFDPAVHEAVATLAVLTSTAHNQVIDQIAPGYRFGTQLLRPAQVVVGKRSPAAQPPAPAPAPAPQARPERPRYVDPYGRPVDQYGRPLRAPDLDGYGRPVQLDRYGRPLRQPYR